MKNKKERITQSKQKPGNETFSCNSSLGMIEEDDWDQEVKGTLVCGVANTFRIKVTQEYLDNTSDKVFLQLSVWPTIRMPTGGSTIPLINTSFLFSSRGHIEESYEIDFLVAQSLLNARKFIQASEKIRNIENRLLKSGTRNDIYRVMILEIIIGESMSQHSQVSEKFFAFKRATLIHSWLELNTDNVTQLLHALQLLQKEQIKQEETPQKLFAIKQRLVTILVANIGSHIEVVRIAMLKTLEYLLDMLNCSLEYQIIDILRVLCFCYPVGQNLTQTPSDQNPGQELYQRGSQQLISFFQYDFLRKTEINYQLPFFQWYAIHNENDCQVQDVKALSHSYVQSAKNCYNHILENLGIVLASASHNLLLQVFKNIIVSQSLNQKLPQELRIYLLKYADQILQICKGDISFPGSFLSDLLEIIVEQPNKTSSQTKTNHSQKRIRVQSAATQAVSPHFSNLQQVCLNLLQTMKLKYFSALSINNIGSQQGHHSSGAISKGQKTFEWLIGNLSDLSMQLERISQNGSKPQSLQDQRKLNILMSIAECVVQSILDEEDNDIQYNHQLNNQRDNRLQLIYCRNDEEKLLLQGVSQNDQKSFISQQNNKQRGNADDAVKRPIHKKMSQNLKYLQVLLPLTQPLIILMNYSVASQDRLHLFKQVWRLLTQILSRLPVKLTKKPHLTLPNLIKPHLTRLNNFMQSSSPSKYMLEFLQIVLLSIQPPLQDIESQLLPTLLRTIPHNLHDEVFQVTSLMLELYSTEISSQNISLLTSVLVHKYTMRSKEHKMLVDKVINRIVLGQQSKLIFDGFIQQCLLDNYLDESSTADDESVFFEKLSLLQAMVDQMLEIHTWHFSRLLNRCNQAFERVFKYNPRSKYLIVKLLLKLTEFYIKFCEPYNHYEYPVFQQANAEIMGNQFANRTVNQSMARAPFINPALNQNPGLNNMVYSEPSVELFSIGHHDDDMYFSGGLDHPRVEMDPQVAAYLMPEVQPINRRAHYQSQHVDYRPQMLLNNNAVHEEDIQQQSELYESPRQALLHPLNTSIICDQVSLIDRNRLLLIQIHAVLIRQVVENSSQNEQQQIHFGIQENTNGLNSQMNDVQDANIKLCTINLMQNLFANLLPTPSLKNMVVQDLIGQDRMNLVQPIRMQQAQHTNVVLQTSTDNLQNLQRMDEEINLHELQQQQQQQPIIQQQAQQNILDMIPDFSEMVIRGQIRQSADGDGLIIDEQSSFQEEFECSDQKYLCARVLTFLKISKYLENIITTTSWANLKSLAICVLNLACHIPNVNILPSKLQRRYKNAIQPLIIKLIQNNKDSESKASALNTLASMCNLQIKQGSNFFYEKLDSVDEGDSFQSHHQRNDQRIIDQFLYTKFDQIQIVKHLDLFRMNSAFVSVAIWQEVFDLQEDQNLVIREAAAALVQLCAPRDSVSHFLQIKREQYKLKVNQLLQKSAINLTQNSTQQPYISGQNSSQIEQTTSGDITNNNFTATLQSQQIGGNTYEEESQDQSSDGISQSSSPQIEDQFTEQEIRLILQTFKLICRPMLSLQADRTSQRDTNNDYFHKIKQNDLFKGIQTFQDLYEDGFLTDERINLQRGVPAFSKQSRNVQIDSNSEDADEEVHSETSSDEVYIFRRQDTGRRGIVENTTGGSSGTEMASRQTGNVMFHTSPQAQQLIQVLQQENEDLGIIDLDDSELFQDDDFEELDDDKLPVLKNTYSKKNRPNNSKSVAIGSRSQGGTLKQLGLRSIIQTNQGAENQATSKLIQNLHEQNEEDRTRYIKSKLVAAAEFIGVDRIEELKSEFDKGSKQSVHLLYRQDQESNKDLEYKLSIRGGLSVASLPVANRRQIQSAGGKRNNKSNSSVRSSNLHVLSQGETLFLPNDLQNLDIEEVQIFVRRKQRVDSSSVYSQYSQKDHFISSETKQDQKLLKTSKLIQTDEKEFLRPVEQSNQNTLSHKIENLKAPFETTAEALMSQQLVQPNLQIQQPQMLNQQLNATYDHLIAQNSAQKAKKGETVVLYPDQSENLGQQLFKKSNSGTIKPTTMDNSEVTDIL